MVDDRRIFSRIPFVANAHVLNTEGDVYLNCRVIDVSLNGLLISRPDNWSGKLTDNFTVDLLLNEAQIVIKMQAEVAHLDANSIGFHCKLIDLDSITHLKKLVELNLADEGLLYRELSALVDMPEN
ncbi:PilZ domain-containing protein [Methylophaga nitratireducenticrescens]|uniref:Cyclic diguanosine monophosphate-binding protein n=1 Tax=Methylophaga nitratireducenticrescens TaxID=754476 RepID=I1XHG8_METNJ|nr:PilZ domain-containing protein [Methylophaga nitratireducenticrescens]AFI83837.1 PilZ domain-containing protein [Methylophaga nitratireducenticrescens]AUZ83956.1 PilZ domain-containing protein [Methylophaga nitratireducenticrescens]